MVHRFRQLDAKVLVFQTALGDVLLSGEAGSGLQGKWVSLRVMCSLCYYRQDPILMGLF